MQDTADGGRLFREIPLHLSSMPWRRKRLRITKSNEKKKKKKVELNRGNVSTFYQIVHGNLFQDVSLLKIGYFF